MKRIMMSFMIVVLMVSLSACKKPERKDVAASFENSVFLGDSITEGFAHMEVLPEDTIIAGAGTTAGFIYDDVDVLDEKKPDKVFIMLGSIDILMPVDDPKELFRHDLTQLINRIRELTPDSKIYLQSITPVTEDALALEPRYAAIEEYNEILQELASTLSAKYVDIGKLAQENPQLYAEDGIHFQKEFYQLWLTELASSL